MRPDGGNKLRADGHGRIEGGHRVLKDHGDAPAADILPDPRGVGCQKIHRLRARLRPVQDTAAVYFRVIRQDTHGGLHRHGFSGPGFAHKGHRLSPAQDQIYAADGVYYLSGGAEADIQILDLQNDLSRIGHVVYLLCMKSAAVCALLSVFYIGKSDSAA